MGLLVLASQVTPLKEQFCKLNEGKKHVPTGTLVVSQLQFEMKTWRVLGSHLVPFQRKVRIDFFNDEAAIQPSMKFDSTFQMKECCQLSGSWSLEGAEALPRLCDAGLEGKGPEISWDEN